MLNFSPESRCDSHTAVALGIFDGVHLGHRAVISAARAKRGLLPCVFTFSAPSVQQKQSHCVSYIYSDLQKRALLASCGIQGIFSADFADYSFHSGEAFAAYILRDILNASAVFCGSDFRFGRDAAYDVRDLTRLGERYGFTVDAVEAVTSGGERVSSSRIRTLLSAGELAAANTLLGAAYRITGVVHHGNEIGRTLGFPTLNQRFAEGQCIPRAGVYASLALRRGQWLPSITNIGLRPTIGDLCVPIAETHIMNQNEILYGETVTVSLCTFLRSEQRFASTKELQQQLRRDCLAAQDYFHQSGGMTI